MSICNVSDAEFDLRRGSGVIFGPRNTQSERERLLRDPDDCNDIFREV